MAIKNVKKVIESTILTDDLDGSTGDDVKTHTVSFEIELSSSNKELMMKTIEPFFAAGRKLGAKPGRKAKSSTPKSDEVELNKKVREWARAEGREVSGRGRPTDALRKDYLASLIEPHVVEPIFLADPNS